MKSTSELKIVSVSDLIPYANNARTHSKDQINKIRASLREFGFVNPLIIDRDNNIIAGHGRLEAAKEEGMTEVPCVYVDELTEAQKKAYILADNRMALDAGWDYDMLKVEFESLKELDFDLELTGFDELEIESLFKEETDELEELEGDDAPETVEERVKPGDVWILGAHRLICGDSTDVGVMDRLLDGERANLLLTDPPYGVKVINRDSSNGHDGKAKATKYRPIEGDETTDAAKAAYALATICTDNQIIFGGNFFADFLPPSPCWIVWDKGATGDFADAELAWSSFGTPIRVFHFTWNGMIREGDTSVEGTRRVHPTQKPVGMLGDILKEYSNEGDSVLDMFGGSGSTLLACEQLGRKCFISEIDPKYCDVIIQRWEDLTGKKAVLEGNNDCVS